MSPAPQKQITARRGPTVVAGPSQRTPVEAFVEAIATELGLGTASTDRRTRRQVLRLTRWATGEGIPLDREHIFDPDTVERFVAEGLAGERSAATYRAVLRRVGPLLTKSAPWEPRPKAVPRRSLAPPYRHEEICTLFGDAEAQPTVSRQRAALGFLLLGLGAGLDGRWASRVRGSDVSMAGGAVRVTVGKPSPRTVVCLERCEEMVADLAQCSGSECLVGGTNQSNRRTGALIERLVTPTGHPRLAPARLRSSWLLWHLEAGTRLPELCQAAGLKGTAVLADLLPYAVVLGEHDVTTMLRNA